MSESIYVLPEQERVFRVNHFVSWHEMTYTDIPAGVVIARSTRRAQDKILNDVRNHIYTKEVQTEDPYELKFTSYLDLGTVARHEHIHNVAKKWFSEWREKELDKQLRMLYTHYRDSFVAEAKLGLRMRAKTYPERVGILRRLRLAWAIITGGEWIEEVENE